jgi:hypothetical protein
MKDKEFGIFYESLLSWCYSLSFPFGAAALAYTEFHFRGNWPPSMGLVFLFAGLALLFCDALIPGLRGFSKRLRRQSMYSSAWISLVGAWLYWQFIGFGGFLILLFSALSLWMLSHRELLLLRLERR